MCMCVCVCMCVCMWVYLYYNSYFIIKKYNANKLYNKLYLVIFF